MTKSAITQQSAEESTRDLRQTGYETVWLIIPACSIGAPHRRDRVWIVGNRGSGIVADSGIRDKGRGRASGVMWRGLHAMSGGQDSHAPDTHNISMLTTGQCKWASGLQREFQSSSNQTREKSRHELNQRQDRTIPGWSENWYEVATRFCRVDARIPDRVDRLKALGNAIVPQVAYQIIKSHL